MTLHQLYEVLKNSVINHPYINTFCVINEPNDLTIDNLKKTIHDKYKPFFYSKLWAEASYGPDDVSWLAPALFVYEKPFLIKGLFSGYDKIEYQLELLVLMNDHVHHTPTEILTDGQRLEPAEIFRRTTEYLLNVLNFTYTVYNKLRDINTEITIAPWQDSGMKMKGVSAVVKFIEVCPPRQKYWEGEYTVPDEPSGSIVHTGVTHEHVIGEVPSGVLNGSNAIFTSAYLFVPESLELFINGVRQKIIADYNTAGGSIITLVNSPASTEYLLINYLKA